MVERTDISGYFSIFGRPLLRLLSRREPLDQTEGMEEEESGGNGMEHRWRDGLTVHDAETRFDLSTHRRSFWYDELQEAKERDDENLRMVFGNQSLESNPLMQPCSGGEGEGLE